MIRRLSLERARAHFRHQGRGFPRGTSTSLTPRGLPQVEYRLIRASEFRLTAPLWRILSVGKRFPHFPTADGLEPDRLLLRWVGSTWVSD